VSPQHAHSNATEHKGHRHATFDRFVPLKGHHEECPEGIVCRGSFNCAVNLVSLGCPKELHNAISSGQAYLLALSAEVACSMPLKLHKLSPLPCFRNNDSPLMSMLK